jgi:FkbM family methyltransferase
VGPRLKAIAIEAADRLLRGYIRYSRVQAGRQRLWELYDRRMAWRTRIRPKIAATPFGFKIHVQLPDLIQKNIWLTGRWEPVITECFRRMLAPGDTFVDVGANIGYYSLLASRIVGSQGHVYSIEASPTIFPLLQGNIALNHAANVEIIHAIAAGHDGEQEFWRAPETGAGGCGQSTAIAMVANASRMRSEGRVRCGTLLSIVPEDRLLTARLIKVDVEGGEGTVLEPILKRLSEFSHRTAWAVELSPQSCPGGQAEVDWIFDSFGKHGYGAFAMRNDYSPAMYLCRPKSVEMKRIAAAPRSLTDVLFLRESDAD